MSSLHNCKNYRDLLVVRAFKEYTNREGLKKNLAFPLRIVNIMLIVD